MAFQPALHLFVNLVLMGLAFALGWGVGFLSGLLHEEEDEHHHEASETAFRPSRKSGRGSDEHNI